jgi:hypothetical protein
MALEGRWRLSQLCSSSVRANGISGEGSGAHRDRDDVAVGADFGARSCECPPEMQLGFWGDDEADLLSFGCAQVDRQEMGERKAPRRCCLIWSEMTASDEAGDEWTRG